MKLDLKHFSFKNIDFKNMSKKEKWILIFLIGALLAVAFMPMERDKVSLEAQVTNTETNLALNYEHSNTMQVYEKELSERLVAILEEMDGVGHVEAWVRIAEGKEVILSTEGTEENSKLEEADSEGGTRIEIRESMNKKAVSDREGNPYVVKTIEPKIEGVFVLAEGASNSTVKKNITEAVEVLFHIDAHRIKVAKKKLED